MKMLLAGALAVAALTVAAPAHAEDRRPCVSLAEFYDMPYSITQARLEDRWEVAGLGEPGAKSNGVDVGIPLPSGGDAQTEPKNPHLEAFTYKACGYSMDEVWVVAYYRRSTHQLRTLVRLTNPNPTLHGHR